MPAEDEGGSGSPSPTAIQDRVAEYWRRAGVIEQALADRPGAPTFRFTEGPPSANGRPHIGHILPRTTKDLQLRYRRMRGYRIVRPMAGWDCHGLPVEIEVEKRHGLKSRKEIESFGVDRFCEECRTTTLSVAAIWEEMSERLGYWLDYRHAYTTMDPTYIESVWWSLKVLFDRGLLEKGHYVLPYCPRCETTLSSHEVAQGYKEATDPSVTVRFPLVGEVGPERSLLVWTTTPWTLVSNLLVTARGDLAYVVVRLADGTEGILAETALPRYFPPGTPIVARMTGRDLANREYRPPFPFVPVAPGRFRVVLDDMVATDDGTGLVHCSPNFGPEDQRIGAREGVGGFDPLDGRGVFTSLVPLVEGKWFKTADPILTKDLAERGLLERSETVRHTYPFCWRCETPLLYRAIDSWFVRTSRFSEALVRHNSTVQWIPAHLREGRFGNFLTEAKDWALSRSRYWGTPLPIWVCSQGHPTCIGSFAELAERSGTSIPPGFDPHRVTVDRISFACPTCGAKSVREPYTIDVWYDSGSAPFAQYHYPFAPGPFEPAAPLDYISEAIDQTRGWFYTLLVLSVALFDRPAYRVALVTGHGLDVAGKKMSKSKGNVLEPVALLGRFGGDMLRWSVLAADFTEGMRITEDGIRQTGARTLGTLTNVVAFYRQNSEADHLPTVRERPRPQNPLDRWLLSRLEATRKISTDALESFDPRPAAQAIRSFVDDLSTWYLRRSRPRFWADADDPARREAHATLSYTLSVTALLLAPFVPFTAEYIHQELSNAPYAPSSSSVHLAAWPEEVGDRDEPLERGMQGIRDLVEVGRELRQRAQVKSRIPLPELVFFSRGPADSATWARERDEILAAELNVRRVTFAPQADPANYPEADWVIRTEEGAPRAALSRRPTPELLEEGLVREVLRRLQQTRKEMRLQFTEPVAVTIGATGDLHRALAAHRETVTRELLADPLELLDTVLLDAPEVRAWEVEGSRFTAKIVRKENDAPRRRTRPASSPRRRRPRTARRRSTAASTRPRPARPSRTSRPGTRRPASPAPRRPAAAGARSRRPGGRSTRPARPRPKRGASRGRMRRSAPAA